MGRERVTTSNCQACGLCCVSPYDNQDSFADVTVEDCERLGVKWVKRNVVFPPLFDQLAFGHTPAIKTRWLRQRSGPLKGESALACVALRGILLKKVRCSVYEQRPTCCREAIKPGTSVCLDLRRESQEDSQAGV